MTSRLLRCALFMLSAGSLSCERGAKPVPAASAVAAAPAPSAAPSAPASAKWKPELPPIVLPAWAKEPVEPESDPRVQGETRSVCSAIRQKRWGSLKQIGTLTRRWRRVQWLYSLGDPGAACEIERLLRAVAEGPQSDCGRLVDHFADSCKSWSPREIR